MFHRHLTRYAGLLHKIKRFLFYLYAIIKSYLIQKTFSVKYGVTVTQLKEINFGIPQGIVVGPILYVLYIADLSITLGTTTANYVEVTAILAIYNNLMKASLRLQ